jgi:hypothetical protein
MKDMNRFENVVHMLRTVFNVDSGLSEDAAIKIYRRAAQSSGKLESLREELRQGFGDPEVSWRRLLSNEDYEVFDAETEDEARSYALRVLWEPLQGL